MTSKSTCRSLIIVDWGSTNLRAYLLKDGICQKRIDAREGLLNIKGSYAKVLSAHLDPWIDKATASIPIVLMGMVGSPSGWMEVPHIPVPGNIAHLAAGSHRLNDFNKGNSWIIPGVAGTGVSGKFDVMRGEEVQYFGAVQIVNERKLKTPSVYCFPGTHTKWIESSNNGELSKFSTAMTGEIFALLSSKSLLAQSIEAGAIWSAQAFLNGLDSSADRGGIMHQLFTVRSLQLSHEHTRERGGGYLSGLLIGNEIRSMLQNKGANIAVVGEGSLAERYQTALTHLDHSAFIIDSQDATIAGALQIFPHLNLQV
jgi:2-dehydro-3-deoxygalactonokinase